MSVKIIEGGDFVVFSHAGDDALRCKDYVRAKLGIEPFQTNGKPKTNHHGLIFPTSTGAAPPQEIAYDYLDESGTLLFQVVRFSNPKTFRQRRPDGNGGWLWNMDGARRVPYRLPELLKAASQGRQIFIAEGEKAVDALVKLGVVATCSPGGAGKWKDEYARHFAGAGDVIILPDNDAVGEKHAADIQRSIASARIVRLPGLPDKGDVYDWISAGGTIEQLVALDTVGAEADRPTGTDLILCCAADVVPQPIKWIWDGRLAVGKHTTIAGEPGTSKSQLTIFITAAITTGGRWPHGEGRAPLGRVVILSAEDGVEDTIVPRLIAAGADLTRAHIIKAGPVSSYFRKADESRGRSDSHKIDDVRSVLEPVGLMAERTGVAILSVTHFAKGSGGTSTTKALHKFIGSIGFVAAPRIAFVVLEDAEDQDRRLLLHAKNNLAPPPPGLAYRLKQVTIDGGIKMSSLDWETGSVMTTADEVLAARNKRDTPQLDEAMALLKSMIPAAVDDISAEAKRAGISWDTMKRAKGALKLEAKKEGMEGGWMWRAPPSI